MSVAVCWSVRGPSQNSYNISLASDRWSTKSFASIPAFLFKRFDHCRRRHGRRRRWRRRYASSCDGCGVAVAVVVVVFVVVVVAVGVYVHLPSTVAVHR